MVGGRAAQPSLITAVADPKRVYGVPFRKIVVIDDQGRFLVPDLPNREYGLWVRGYQQQMKLACTVPGIKATAAASILAETGMDMSPEGPFPDCHHLASWGTVCPGNNESAGKRKSDRTRQGNRWLRATLTQTAGAGAADKKSLFQMRYQRVKLRRGGQRAGMAIAHAPLIAVYWGLRNSTP